MYALCDVDSMYSSCEKVFDPSIRKRPVVVLTNNDGCVCAACGIAKRMGIGKKFVPYFQIKDELDRAGAVVRSSNYELIADLSGRFMDVCTRFAPHSHIYSVDECFLYYGTGYTPSGGWESHAKEIRRAVWKQVRLPIGVGIGPTPTLAKAASHASKRIEGFNRVAVIDSEKTRQLILQQMSVTDVWGIGKRLGARLADLGIDSAWQLSRMPPGLAKKHFSVLVESTVHELNGIVKLSWDDVRAPKREIYSSRSFGQRVLDKAVLRQAVASHIHTAARKLRKQGSLCGTLVVFASNSPHDREPYYRRSRTLVFKGYTSDTQQLLQAATSAVEQIYHPGVRFYRCGVGLMDLVSSSEYQQDLFQQNQDNPKLMECMDRINDRYGRGAVFCASQGVEKKFEMRREFLSPCYTTRLSDLPVIKC